jgi:hypothetical protein
MPSTRKPLMAASEKSGACRKSRNAGKAPKRSQMALALIQFQHVLKTKHGEIAMENEPNVGGQGFE